MMKIESLLRNLMSAAETERRLIPEGNLFKSIGYDKDDGRLGWVYPPAWKLIENSLTAFSGTAKGKNEFVFIGMGGSVNGIKTLISLAGMKNVHTIDSLDPEATERVLGKLKNLKTTLVIPISKSGTTAETQLIAQTFKDIIGGGFADNFLWMSDSRSFARLDACGWKDVKKIAIQVNGKSDIGGRFSCPHTLIFLIPLFLALGGDIGKTRNVWEKYIPRQNGLRGKACQEAVRFAGSSDVRISADIDADMAGGFDNWIIQLIQESLGSKKEGFFIKTVTKNGRRAAPGFMELGLGPPDEDRFSYMMSYMYFLQVFVALLAYDNGINFVTQPYVDVYKKELKALGDGGIERPPCATLEILPASISKKLARRHEFIDCILFFDASKNTIAKAREALSSGFPEKIISVFVGSDWNHHSYQAAFGDTKTFYVIATADRYKKLTRPDLILHSDQNVRTLKAIAYATFKTMRDKAVYCAIKK